MSYLEDVRTSEKRFKETIHTSIETIHTNPKEIQKKLKKQRKAKSQREIKQNQKNKELVRNKAPLANQKSETSGLRKRNNQKTIKKSPKTKQSQNTQNKTKPKKQQRTKSNKKNKKQEQKKDKNTQNHKKTHQKNTKLPKPSAPPRPSHWCSRLYRASSLRSSPWPVSSMRKAGRPETGGVAFGSFFLLIVWFIGFLRVF